jgi:hypothetical protein
MKAKFLIEGMLHGSEGSKVHFYREALNLFKEKYESKLLDSKMADAGGLYIIWELSCECNEYEVVKIQEHAEWCARKNHFAVNGKDPIKPSMLWILCQLLLSLLVDLFEGIFKKLKKIYRSVVGK